MRRQQQQRRAPQIAHQFSTDTGAVLLLYMCNVEKQGPASPRCSARWDCSATETPHLLLVFQGAQAERQAGEPVVDLVEHIPDGMEKTRGSDRRQKANQQSIDRNSGKSGSVCVFVCVAEGGGENRQKYTTGAATAKHTVPPHQRFEKNKEHMAPCSNPNANYPYVHTREPRQIDRSIFKESQKLFHAKGMPGSPLIAFK